MYSTDSAQSTGQRGLCGVVANVIDYDIVVNELKLYSYYYFWTSTLGFGFVLFGFGFVWFGFSLVWFGLMPYQPL